MQLRSYLIARYWTQTTRASIAEVDANPESYYTDGTKVYVRTRDSRAVDSSIRVYLNVNNLRSTGNYTVYPEGIDFEGGPSAVRVENSASSQTAKLLAKNCTFKYSTTGNAMIINGENAILQNCVAAQGYMDGFNYHAQNDTSPKLSRSDASDEKTLGEKAAVHNCGIIVRIYGKYHGNSGPNVLDVGGAKAWLIACEIYSSMLQSSSGVNVWSEGEVWMYNCMTHGSTYDLTVANSGIIHTRNLRSGSQNNIVSGTIDTY
jgi:hypothetical protein